MRKKKVYYKEDIQYTKDGKQKSLMCNDLSEAFYFAEQLVKQGYADEGSCRISRVILDEELNVMERDFI